ncbi:ATP-binding protein [Campylobacter coli]|uniref:dynamin family protein n=1 Tax=Campylobacter coli TaxID=195 RepID=UPI00093020BF|nr:dynamin family protein [Campylobacter coli]EAC1312591.1 ATP-binding protein [Campylobacter coli]EAH4947396.1 ATP-binding protein [Campylobacter coli]EAH5258438.1 ATP-binding protein [Campylobacter coli]EAH7287924.1 ATP-binding protein [Campylobacter coli]EAH9613202.1 ATP-binding protein [Campylobacter coli]
MKELLQKLWQNELQLLDFNASFKDKNILDVSELAIILSVNKDNYERYFLLKEFSNICKKIDLRVDIFSIQKAQICVLNMFREGFIPKQDLLKALRILQKISNNAEILEYIQNIQVQSIDKKALFQSGFNELNHINMELSQLSFDENSKIRLQKTLEKFQKLEFNIAITGVMNSGKSSLLNALLKEDFLGVSNIPETANLTLLSYGNTQEAVIYFWDTQEWDNILKSSKFSKELKEFIDELALKIDIKEYVQDKALTQKINLKELKEFSSAKNQISALIKKIEIKSNLEFLKNNISIVDTPGLDDIVVQREILTNEYLKESDFLIHLMNASQALTQKDAEFLIHCLLNSRLSKFLIVLAKADLLSQKDLDEVINYTKESLKARLENFDTHLIEKIDFLCVSAKMASDFYKGLSSEESFKKSGMKEFEEYLFNELYSGEKSKIILQAYKKELLLELRNILNEYEMQNKLIKEDGQGLSEENDKLLLEFKAKEEALKEAKEEISNSILNLENFENGVDNLVLLLAKKLKERLIDEIKYLKDKAQKININRILNMIDITVKDGINDILREVKFENIKKIEELKTSLALKYDFLKDDFDNGFEGFKDEISKKIENIFSDEKFALLRLQIEQIISTKVDLFELETKLTEVIFSTFESFNIGAILKDLDINGAFFAFLNERMKNYEVLQKEKLASIEHLINNLKNQNADILFSYEGNLEKIAKLQQLEVELMNAN